MPGRRHGQRADRASREVSDEPLKVVRRGCPCDRPFRPIESERCHPVNAYLIGVVPEVLQVISENLDGCQFAIRPKQIVELGAIFLGHVSTVP